MTRSKTTAATVGLVGLAAGALVAGKRRATSSPDVRGAPPCQHPDCSEPADAENGYEKCPDHAPEFVEVPVNE